MKLFLSSLAAGVVAVSVAMAMDFKPAVVYDMGGKFDKSFNEGVYQGIKRFSDETGIEVMEFEITNEAQREQALRRMVSKGASVVLGVGFGQADAINAVAADNPDVNFAIIDVSWLDQPNLRQYSFKEQEGSYLVGMAAALKSETNKVGFIGGMDIPLISAFECGYRQGVAAVSPDIMVIANMTGTTPAAWNDPAKGAELAQAQIDRGADVIYQAAGGTGMGVIRAVADAGKLAIGVDSNQNHLAPGSVLTSMLKRVDNAAYGTMMDAYKGEFTAEVLNLGLAEEGVGYALDEYNVDLMTTEIIAQINTSAEKIKSGQINVHDYRSDNSCPL